MLWYNSCSIQTAKSFQISDLQTLSQGEEDCDFHILQGLQLNYNKLATNIQLHIVTVTVFGLLGPPGQLAGHQGCKIGVYPLAADINQAVLNPKVHGHTAREQPEVPTPPQTKAVALLTAPLIPIA